MKALKSAYFARKKTVSKVGVRGEVLNYQILTPYEMWKLPRVQEAYKSTEHFISSRETNCYRMDLVTIRATQRGLYLFEISASPFFRAVECVKIKCCHTHLEHVTIVGKNHSHVSPLSSSLSLQSSIEHLTRTTWK